MIDIKDLNYVPDIAEICEFVGNPLIYDFCEKMEREYKAVSKTEFSKCNWEYGWNIKFKKGGKSLCTVYPRENYFTVLVVVGNKEKEKTEEMFPDLSSEVQGIYAGIQEGNGQRWLMIDLEDEDERYNDVWKLIGIRRKSV